MSEHVAASAADALARTGALVRPALAEAVARLDPELREPAEHHMAGGGKGVRAALAVIGAAASGGTEREGVLGAVAVELTHNYSLVHDDIIDNDEERRHRPTVWAAFGTGRAIVVGDALANLATQLLLEDPTPARVRAAQLLADSTSLMISGQADDMAFERRDAITAEECLKMEEGKTGALLGCASAIGGVLAGADDATIKALTSFGLRLGMAFQAVDDVLGIWGEPRVTGKPVGNDLLRGKQGLPMVLALTGNGQLGKTARSWLTPPGLRRRDLTMAVELLREGGVAGRCQGLTTTWTERALVAAAKLPLSEGGTMELEILGRWLGERWN